MKYRMIWSLVYLFSGGLLSFAQDKSPYGLLTNLLSKPELSVLTTNVPKFSWIVPSTVENDYQSAYQIWVASDSTLLVSGKADVWDSGRVLSDQSTHVRFGGKELKQNSSYYWAVKTWNRKGDESEMSEVQKFNIGDVTRKKNWPGESRWVQFPQSDGSVSWTFEDRHPINYHASYPIDCHRKENGTWFIDFKQAAFSNISLTLRWNAHPCEKKDTLIRICIGEKSVLDSIDRKPGGGVIFKEYFVKVHDGVGKYSIEIPRFKPHYPHSQVMPEHMQEVIPFRYCEVNAGGLDLSVISAEQMRLYTEYDEYASSFVSSDTLLNEIYNLCRYSVKANTFNGDYAASQRERMMYEADAYIHQLGHYATDREFMTARFSLENMIYHATWPTEWIFHSIMMVWMDYLHTGDIDVIKKNYKDIQPKLMMALIMPNGLLSTRTGLVTKEFCRSIFYQGNALKDIVDWPWANMSTLKGGETDEYQFSDYNTVVNAFHYHALDLMENMAKVIGEKKDAFLYAKRKKELYKIFQKSFFDQKRGLYVDGLGLDHASLHANLYPLVFGLVPEKHKDSVLEYMKEKEMACGVYSANYLLEGLFDAGEETYAMHLLTSKSDRSWYNMLRVGATMTTEAWDNKYKSNNGWSHAWSSSPVHIIPRKVMGIEPTKPGFKHIRIKPKVAGLSWAKVKLPTIRGFIQTEFVQSDSKFTLSVSIPANMRADVYVPIREKGQKCTLILDGTPVDKLKFQEDYILLENIYSGVHHIELNY
ncbi:alpha-L-rhamnosidase-related protein [Parabacteroides johnsonii]|uniref:alpha-L-rhamnosidase-related protein n=1 Tax=Parabacteroides johnsonii TaxID=387661 RepID=UPI0018986D7A|nr:alpha-L-rhamnosidase C-terminal domain-containing protein [Parabacteroides johnsonii]